MGIGGHLFAVCLGFLVFSYAFVSKDDHRLLDQFLQSRDDEEDVKDLSDTSTRLIDNVIVAGAWRRPDGELSKAFRVRLDSALRWTLLLGAKNLVLTGGRNDSYVSEEYLRNFPTRHIFGANDGDKDGNGEDGQERKQKAEKFKSEKDPRKSIKNKVFLSDVDQELAAANFVENVCPEYLSFRLQSMKELVNRFESVDQMLRTLPNPPFRLVMENSSKTTHENAVYAAEKLVALSNEDALDKSSQRRSSSSSLLKNGIVDKETTVVISSHYHMRRCKLLFSKHLVESRHRVFVIPAEETETEIIAPSWEKGWIVWIDEVPLHKHPRFAKIAHWVPTFVKKGFYTFWATVHHWNSHIRVSVLSLGWYSTVREYGAYLINVRRGHLTYSEVFQSVRDYLSYE